MKHKHFAAAVLNLYLVVACSGAYPATSAPSPTPDAPIVFVSERNGYSLELPDESWRATEFDGAWHLGEYFQQDSPGVDLFERRDRADEVIPGLYLYVASQQVTDSWTFDKWVAGHDRINRAVEPCWFPGTNETVQVSGVPARVSTYRCPDWEGAGPWEIVETMAMSNGRGYAIYVFPGWVGEYDMTVAELQAAAAEWLARFTFEVS